MWMDSETRGSHAHAAAPVWNPDLLSSFSFLMAGHGRSVSAAMMLGDAAYARRQLAVARSLDDGLLRRVVREMESGVVCAAAQAPVAGVSPAHRLSIPYR